jgi:hypothetical protein
MLPPERVFANLPPSLKFVNLCASGLRAYDADQMIMTPANPAVGN